jgi:DNA-binding transcriptional ArsR family regulator
MFIFVVNDINKDIDIDDNAFIGLRPCYSIMMHTELREKILALLSQSWPFRGKSVEEIAAEGEVSRSSAFNYLKVLEAEGKVVSEKVGRTWYYRLADAEGIDRVGYEAPSVKLMEKLLKEIKKKEQET